MSTTAVRTLLAIAFGTLIMLMVPTLRANPFPEPAKDEPRAATHGLETAVFAGGCFWGVEAVFDHLDGVSEAVSGYAGGNKSTAQYETVSRGSTGHAESVQISYDPAKITYGQLLKVFFSIAHDPTELNRQGPDTGTQYRSSIFFANDEQKRVAEAYIQQLTAADLFRGPIVTTVVPLTGFYAAEDYHQNFLSHNPDYPYIMIYDQPKIDALDRTYPAMVKKK